jgi:hypothetical protein
MKLVASQPVRSIPGLQVATFGFDVPSDEKLDG